ncbi:glutamate-rich protein 3 [Elgaria multicarinata webbii]|uniref:glutamate-rich protein 3 n=1 Tax=Elgaria multicarinata webbii TaxID=159646 RepID=UPI002FCCD8FC
MNHPHPGFLANYNSLTDKHLAGYFSNTRIRRHLQRSGLVSRSGRIISEKEYQLNAMRKDHQKYIRECLAQAIFHKVLDMEHHHQVEIKRKLENSARRERVHKIKVERSRRAAEETNHLLSPHPPTAPRNRFGRRKLGNRGHSGHLASYPRPSTAPGNIQHPLRLQPLYSNATTESAPKAASRSRPKFLTLEKDHHLASGGDKGVLNTMHSMDYSTGISPYRLPIINNYVTPIPPLPPPKNDHINAMKGGTSRGRRFRPTTAPNGLEQLLMRDTGKFYKPQVQSNAYVTMAYLGKTVHLSYDLLDYREEIKIYQQHCGGENLCVFRGKLLEGETFQFISKRHYGFPFSLTFYLNGIQVDRLSSCCEYKHRKGTRLGGKHGYFGFINVERSSPCYRCIIAMGLDKKPSPPKKKVTDEDEAKKEESWKEEVKCKLRESSSSSSREENKFSRLSFPLTPKQRKEFVEEMELEARKGEIQRASDECEKSQERLANDAYDEDFEADEEKSDGKVNEEGQPDDQMNGMSKSPSDDEKDNLDHERENKNSSPKASRASDSERDESDGYAKSDLEEEDKQDRKHAPALTSRTTTSYSSENDSECESRKEDDEQDNTDIHSEYESETAMSQKEEGQETDVEEEEGMGEAETTTAKHVPGALVENEVESNLKDMSPVSEKPKLVGSVDTNTREDREEEELVHFKSSAVELEPRSKESSKDEEEGDSKSVKEKIAEAIGNDQLFSSEPEPSDSSTEDEEEMVVATRDKHEVPDGASLAKDARVHGLQKVAEQVDREKQMVGKERALKEEELVDEEGPKEGTQAEELLAQNRTVEHPLKNELVTGDTDLEKEAVVESDLSNVEEEAMYEEEKSSEGKVKAKQELKEPKETAPEHETSIGEEILGRGQLEGEKVEDQNIAEEFMASEGEEGGEKVVEACEVLGTIKLVGRKAIEGEAHEAEEIMEEALQAGEALGTTFAERGILGEAESEGNATLKDTEHEAEAIENDGLVEKKCIEEKSLKADEYMEERKHFKMELGKVPLVHAEFIAPEAKVEEIISTDEKAASSGDKSIGGGNDIIGEVPSDTEEVLQVEKLGKTSPEMSEMKNIPTEEHSTLVKEESLVEEASQVYESTRIISETEKEENVVQAMGGTTEQGWMEDMLMSKVAVPEMKQGIGKEELFAENVPETTALVTEETIRQGDAERKIVVQGKVEGKEAEREMAAKGEREDEEEETEIEVVSLVTGLEGETVSKMTIMRRQRVVSVREETVAEAKDIHELSAQKVALGGGAVNKEEGMENEANFQDEVEQTPEEAVAEETSIFLAMHKEEITVQEETEDEESDTEEQMKGEGAITLANVKEALLIGIQQFITDVSQMKEDKDDKEDKEERPQMEGLAEEMSPQEDAVSEDFFTVMVAKERWVSESDKAEGIGTGESVEGIFLEGKYGSGNRRTSGQEECPIENVTVTGAILQSTQWSEREQHQEFVGSSD